MRLDNLTTKITDLPLPNHNVGNTKRTILYSMLLKLPKYNENDATTYKCVEVEIGKYDLRNVHDRVKSVIKNVCLSRKDYVFKSIRSSKDGKVRIWRI